MYQPKATRLAHAFLLCDYDNLIQQLYIMSCRIIVLHILYKMVVFL